MTAAELLRVLAEEQPTGRFGGAPPPAPPPLPVTPDEAAQHRADLIAAVYLRGGRAGGTA